LDACIIGEPTNPAVLGEMAKIGRRGSLTVTLEAKGVQGHVGYPHLADNAAHRLVRTLHALIEAPLDDGSEHFEPSTLQVTTIDIGNPAANIVPARARAVLNIRYGDRHDPASLRATAPRAAGTQARRPSSRPPAARRAP